MIPLCPIASLLLVFYFSRAKNCVSVHFNCRCVCLCVHRLAAVKPRRLCDGSFHFVIIRCFGSRNGKRRRAVQKK